MHENGAAAPGGPPGAGASITFSCLVDSEDPTKIRRFRHLVRRVWKQGPRPCAEILLEFAPDLDALIERLERYAPLDPTFVRIADAGDWLEPRDVIRIARRVPA
jgi:hypothetical protein